MNEHTRNITDSIGIISNCSSLCFDYNTKCNCNGSNEEGNKTKKENYQQNKGDKNNE